MRALVRDAMVEGRPFDQRVRLLGIAQDIATMHKHWNGGSAPLADVELKLMTEIKKEEERKAALKRWDKYEKFIGNFVMKTGEAKMADKGSAPSYTPTGYTAYGSSARSATRVSSR